jgi:hypothetical protein
MAVTVGSEEFEIDRKAAYFVIASKNVLNHPGTEALATTARPAQPDRVTNPESDMRAG